MTDPVSMYGRLVRPDTQLRTVQADRASDASEPPAASAVAAGAVAATNSERDEFVLSEVSRNALQAETFDRGKVDAIKQALREGNYPLDSRRIAESFLAIERLIDG